LPPLDLAKLHPRRRASGITSQDLLDDESGLLQFPVAAERGCDLDLRLWLLLADRGGAFKHCKRPRAVASSACRLGKADQGLDIAGSKLQGPLQSLLGLLEPAKALQHLCEREPGPDVIGRLGENATQHRLRPVRPGELDELAGSFEFGGNIAGIGGDDRLETGKRCSVIAIAARAQSLKEAA
jgi:hypothetical protein